jgi:MFS family permease
MLKGLLSGLTSRTAFLSVILISNAFVWYYCADDILLETSKIVTIDYFANLQIWSANFAGLIISALTGAYLTKRFGNKTRFLSIWMLLGIALPFASLAINPADIYSVTLLGLIFSSSLGIGLPSCMGYFTSHTGIEQRGRLGGMMMLFTGVSAVAISTLGSNDVLMQAVFLAAWRGFGLVSFILLKPRSDKTVLEDKVPSYKAIISQRSFILYFVPWVMFSLVNYLTTPVVNHIFNEPNLIATIMAVGNVLIAVFAIVGGFLVDTVGRKRIAIIGFVVLGLGYAVLGLSPNSPLSWYFHTAVDGVAWGLLLVVFVTTVWGDLSHEATSDKYYAVGVLPFFVSRFLQVVLADQLESIIPENAYAVFSFAAFFLFLAVLPLVYAPETLPEKVMKERELKTYLEKAQKIAAKAQKQEQEKTQESEDAGVEFEVDHEDLEEAEELAEKYY